VVANVFEKETKQPRPTWGQPPTRASVWFLVKHTAMSKKAHPKRESYWRAYLIVFLFALNFFVWYTIFQESRQGALLVSFLDIGQGDAVFIEAPNGNQLLLDGGPDKSVLRALGKVMPFYDRSIDMLAVSHPHRDHLEGLNYILERYKVGVVVSSGTKSESTVPDISIMSLFNYY